MKSHPRNIPRDQEISWKTVRRHFLVGVISAVIGALIALPLYETARFHPWRVGWITEPAFFILLLFSLTVGMDVFSDGPVIRILSIAFVAFVYGSLGSVFVWPNAKSQ